jgi:hypothetical protein
MASVIGTHVVGRAPGGLVVHVPPNGNSSWSDYAPIIDIYEMGYQGAQGVAFSGGLITNPASLTVTGNGVTDDSAAINAAYLALAGSGKTLYFSAGAFLVTTNAINTQGVSTQVGPGASFTGTYASTLYNASAALSGSSAPGFARAVMTTVATSTTYTGTTTGTLTFGTNAAIGTQDGVTTLAVGDCVILQPGTLGSCAITACDSGPWIIASLGGVSAKVVLTRPSWFPVGAIIPIGYQIKVGPEGTQYADINWTSWANTPAAATIAVSTTATNPLWYPDHVIFAATLVSGFVTTTTIPIRSTTLTGFAYQPTNYNGGSTTAKFITGAIGSGGAATAAGGVGTGSISITACAVAGTVVAADISTGNLHIWNRP